MTRRRGAAAGEAVADGRRRARRTRARRIRRQRRRAEEVARWQARGPRQQLQRGYPRNREDGNTLLSIDGSEGGYYDPNSIVWSPDSKKIAAYKIKPGYRRYVHYVQSSPEDQLQPKHSTLQYAKPGDVLDVEKPVLFHVDTRKQIVVDEGLFPNAYDNLALDVAQRQSCCDVRVQPARPPGVPRHRDRCADRKDASDHQ